jgi:hypothetical protein
MEKLQETFNFDDIGGKIKGLAMWSCWISIVVVWIGAAIAFLICLFTRGLFFYAFLMPIGAIVYSVLIWIGSWTLYAFGEYIEDTKAIRHNTSVLVQQAKREPQRIVEQTQPVVPQKTTPAATAPKAAPAPAEPAAPARNDYQEGEYVPGRAYSKGEQVIFEGKRYTCEVNSSVWSPIAAPSQWKEAE